MVLVQTQRGSWETTGTLVDILEYNYYLVKMDNFKQQIEWSEGCVPLIETPEIHVFDPNAKPDPARLARLGLAPGATLVRPDFRRAASPPRPVRGSTRRGCARGTDLGR